MANCGQEQSTFNSELYNLSFDSVEEDSDNVWFSLIQNLSYDKLEALKAIFKERENTDTIGAKIGNSKYALQSLMLFDNIVKDSMSTVTWNVFLDFLIKNIGPKVDGKALLTINKIECVPHTKYGRIGLYDGNLNFLTSYHVIMTREDITRSEDERRRRNRWVTDAIFCEDVLMFIVTNTARSIMIYEASVYKCYENFINEESNESVLFMGDCCGEIICFKFLQPKQGFLRKKHNDKMSLFYWIELPNEKEYVIIKYHGRIHKNNVKQIKYCAKNNSVFTCSRDSDASVVQRHIFNKRKQYIFKMKRGASCFAICSTLKLLITGSDDGTIRIWNSVVVSKPIAVLLGHQSDIVDIQIMENQQMLLSCSADGVII
ncbi:hypothetical protein NQ314_017021 [Rhamnusium bicolor]|uniref:Uncharacterized protein n=1 Tax=Rhamnusium bicolor TaxID=1586634 RepID=A0AAV8WU97_9CUCU|nr:hypothetical protein NQ314_017021 [Rhamnusium bicolor]